MNERDKVRLRDMLDASQKAVYFAEGKTHIDLEANDMFMFVVTRANQIVGEAASKVSDETKSRHPEIRWKEIIGMRQKIVHDYAAVDIDVVRDVITLDLPLLIDQLQPIILSND